MKVYLAVILGLLISGCASVPEVAASKSSRIQPSAASQNSLAVNVDTEVHHFFRDYFQAVEAGEPDGILALVDTNFVIKWPVGDPITDRDQLRAALASLQTKVRQEVQWQVVEAHVHEKWAWARVNETAKHFSRGGESRTLEGSHLVILRKDRGRWLLHRAYGSLNALPRIR